ncbi:carboxypeptidase-like regulatory domain-containing protein [Nemorincola caseinilytica]|uniref:Carboxypeptidase-like regulatory domain-containing protein n=1 Tax=Nemorincola caseinilytica TaxID=2054315 RepID=A0ABP8NK46_9BACT
MLLLTTAVCAHAQKAIVSGVVRNEMDKGLGQALVADEVTGLGATTNTQGYYYMEVPANKKVTIIYIAQGYIVKRREVLLSPGASRIIDVQMERLQAVQGPDIVIKDQRKREDAGSVILDVSRAVYMPSVVDGVTAMIKQMVGTNNELTSQYNVRGGNFDENLVYVNDFEIYRPFLVRTGQQEGLSFVNSDLVANVNFSVGGFQSKYGDKMSSVLDVSYKKPKEFAGSVTTGLLGASMHLEGASKNQRLTYLVGARQKSNQYVLQAQPTKGIYNPSFTDIQALLNYRVGNWELEGIANYARNRFTFFPETSSSSFGVLNQAYVLNVFYEGGEFDQFDSRFGGLSATYHKVGSKFRIKFLGSGFRTNEYETYDIFGAYLLGELQTDLSKRDFGQIKTYLGAGAIHNFARNYLNVNVGDMGTRGSYDAGDHLIQFGANATVTAIGDELHEWERRDSAAFSQPYDPNGVNMVSLYHSSTDLNYTRLSGFVQDYFKLDSGRLTATAGIRFNHSLLNDELNISPRLQMSYRPRSRTRDLVLKLAAGKYVQPPFYREMRDVNGGVNKDLLAQKSWQFVLGADYNFSMFRRPFKVTGETYYKYLWDQDPYRYDNVRIRYTGKNDAIGRVYGGEVRLYGELVEGATSWISIGMLKAEQKITDSPSIAGYDNYFPMPTDQRFMLGMYFEDYLRKNKNFKAHVNVMYASGLPVGPPRGHLYQNILRIPDYKRVDIGFSALLLDGLKKEYRAHSFFNHIHSIWGSLEVFNLLSIQNTLSYTWIQDQSSGSMYAVPNRLTTRLLNVKLHFTF